MLMPGSGTGSGQHSPLNTEGEHFFGFLQMNHLIINQKVPLSASKQTSMSTINLSKNALQYLYPIRDQKLLLMSKERNNNFANIRLSIKLCENKSLVPVKQKSLEFDTPTKPKAERIDKPEKPNEIKPIEKLSET